MSAAKILYLGLRPKPHTFHYPVIRTQFCADLTEALSLWPQFTHVIFTSQTTVEYWPGPWDKKIIAIGEATAHAIRKRGGDPVVAAQATQEGVIEMITDGYFFLPQSKRARPDLANHLKKRGISFFQLALYETHFQKLEPVPDLADFDEVVFTSPSTVEGFLRIYGTLPKKKKLTPIGPITEQVLLNAKTLFCWFFFLLFSTILVSI